MIPSLTDIAAVDDGPTAADEVKQRLDEAFKDIKGDAGVRHCAFTVWRVPGIAEDRLFDHDSFGPAWHMARERENYVAVDPMLSAASRAMGPVDWHDVRRNDPRVRRMLRILANCGGGGEAVTIPLRGPFGELSLLTLTSGVTSGQWPAVRERIMRRAMLPHHRMHRMAMTRLFGLPPSVQFRASVRERQCLSLAAQGRTTEEIAWQPGLAASTINSYFETAMDKLRASNRVSAVARAVAAGVIPPP